MEDFPVQIFGETIEDIAEELYDALAKMHTSVDSFRLEYPIRSPMRTLLGWGFPFLKREPTRVHVNSKRRFMDEFLTYVSSGKRTRYHEEDDISTTDLSSESLLIYPLEDGQCRNDRYIVVWGVRKNRAACSRVIKSIVSPLAEAISKIRGDSKLVRYLNTLSRCSDECITNAEHPLYIKIYQKTKAE